MTDDDEEPSPAFENAVEALARTIYEREVGPRPPWPSAEEAGEFGVFHFTRSTYRGRAIQTLMDMEAAGLLTAAELPGAIAAPGSVSDEMVRAFSDEYYKPAEGVSRPGLAVPYPDRIADGLAAVIPRIEAAALRRAELAAKTEALVEIGKLEDDLRFNAKEEGER